MFPVPRDVEANRQTRALVRRHDSVAAVLAAGGDVEREG